MPSSRVKREKPLRAPRIDEAGYTEYHQRAGFIDGLREGAAKGLLRAARIGARVLAGDEACNRCGDAEGHRVVREIRAEIKKLRGKK